ncbi:unnamed protein product [marine sediment metagenome]|uniref:Helix-turn-helix domain-containing protein n=1 Tax=marine sediment metagenome TaxID=412755 RepID=X1U412_9ZZZZ
MEGKTMLTITEVAKRLGCHYMTIYYWVKQGKLPAVQFDKIYRIDEEELKKFLEDRKVVKK